MNSKEVGLAVGQILGQQLFGMRELHYGLWSEGMEVSLSNFSKAQENYSRFLLERIPVGTRRILDVGSGTGEFARRLIAEGYEVDCVSPSPYLTALLREAIGTRGRIYPTKMEDLDTDQLYDLVLFSESFQYVDMRLALNKALSCLQPGKHIIVSDFFRRNVPGDSPLGGGHLFEEFEEILASSPVEVVVQEDLTEQTAPTMEMFGNFLNEAGIPLRDLVCDFIQRRHPLISKFLVWKLRKRFAKVDQKYFSGGLNGASFTQFKTYRFYLLTVTRPPT